MKKYNPLINKDIILRFCIVCIGSVLAFTVIRMIISNMLDSMFRSTESEVYYDLFYFLSTYQIVILAICLLISIILFSKWILQPSIKELASIIDTYIDMDKDIQKIELPKGMEALQTELVQINKDIQLWKQAAKAAEHKKDELVVYLAHDIRTPLASTLGYLSLLEDHELLNDEQKSKFIKIALAKAESIQTLVDELFEVTRYNISQIELKKEFISIVRLLQQLIEELTPEMETRQIKMNLKISGDGSLFADPEKLGRAFENIVVNAIRYSPKNEIVDIEVIEKEESIAAVFTNKGIQVHPDELNRIFEKFYRSDQSRQTVTGGSGLGLAIAKNIIEAHQGTIIASSDDQYIRFVIELPK